MEVTSVLETRLWTTEDEDKVNKLEDYCKEVEVRYKQAEEAARDTRKAGAAKNEKEAAKRSANLKREQGAGAVITSPIAGMV